MKDITLQDLLKSGAHFGHSKTKWHPKMAPFIFTQKEGIHIIDLQKTQDYLKKALEFIADIARKNGTILFVGTKRQAKEIITKAAKFCGMPYVSDRWLGGTFTNFNTLHKQFLKLRDLEEKEKEGDFKKYTKFEQHKIREEIKRMEKLFGGIKMMDKLPEAMFVVDIVIDDLPVKEARRKGVKIVALIDTNANPELVDYPIPTNDDATKVIELMVGAVAQTIKENMPEEVGKKEVKK
ncbi:MAG: 30S ribosomal protein S2 [Patescibacteria group bacterium]